MRIRYVKQVYAPDVLRGDVGDERDIATELGNQLVAEGYAVKVESPHTNEGESHESEG